MSAERALSFALAGALVSSYVLTWRLWDDRSVPPNLPALGGLGLSFGLPLVVAAALTVLAPRVGAVAHGVVLLVAILADQTRLQPEFLSLALLLLAAAWPRNGVHIARWHLITLWFWAGFNKVLSSGWPEGPAEFIASTVGLEGVSEIFVVAVPAIEVGLGIMGVWPRAWRFLRWAAALFHVGTFVSLALVPWNAAVWPWNLALAVTAFVVFRGRATGRPAALPAGRSGAALAAVAAVLLIFPAGFYLGLVDAYPAHNLYTGNTEGALVCRVESGERVCTSMVNRSLETLGVPLPPQRRLFDRYFDLTCEPGETLVTFGRWVRGFERSGSRRPCGSETAIDLRTLGTD